MTATHANYTEQEVVLPDAKGAGQERICDGPHPGFPCGDRFARSWDFLKRQSHACPDRSVRVSADHACQSTSYGRQCTEQLGNA